MRNTIDLPDNSSIHIHYGTDHAIGKFLDITDDRFAGIDADDQGEGYVFEWSEMFGITINLIGAEIEDIDNQGKLIELTKRLSWY